MRGLQAVVDRIGLIQIDSVNVLARAHLMPLYSRLGPYDPNLLHQASGRAPRRLVETWAHEASFVPPETYRLLDWRRRRVGTEAWGSISRVEDEHPDLVREVRDCVAGHGAVTSREVHALLDQIVVLVLDAGDAPPRFRAHPTSTPVEQAVRLRGHE